MTRMTFEQPGLDTDPEFLEPERVSILAILALVFGLLCFLPIIPLLGVICGVGALIFIGQSRGRLAGTGMAVAGLILGLLFTALQGALLYGGMQTVKMVERQMFQPASDMLAALDKNDNTKIRDALLAESNAIVTDEQIAAFRDAYQAELGAVKTAKPSMMELMMAYGELGQRLQGYQGRNDFIPIPVLFEKGNGLVVAQFDQSQPPQNPMPGSDKFIFRLRNISIETATGKTIDLIDPAALPPLGKTNIKIGPDGVKIEGGGKSSDGKSDQNTGEGTETGDGSKDVQKDGGKTEDGSKEKSGGGS